MKAIENQYRYFFNVYNGIRQSSETAANRVMADYVQNKTFNKKYYSDLVYELIKKTELIGTKRKEINSLLITKWQCPRYYPQTPNCKLSIVN